MRGFLEGRSYVYRKEGDLILITESRREATIAKTKQREAGKKASECRCVTPHTYITPTPHT